MARKHASTKECLAASDISLTLDDDPFDNPDLRAGDFGEIEEPQERPRDGYVEAAMAELESFFSTNPESVFYQRQLQVLSEKKYFHWITVRALVKMVQEGKLAAEEMPLSGIGTITFYQLNSYRYWKRDAEEIIKLVVRFSEPSFTHALGAHGETLFDAALPTAGFMPIGRKVRRYRGREWLNTGHDLDRVFERDGLAYGAEVKNTLSYIEKEELETKVKMCNHIGLIPLFIVRMAPKSYVKLVSEAGGFTLIFKYQLYPYGQKSFADEVRARLGIPVDSPTRIEDGTVKRLLDWHIRMLKVRGNV
jgi:hypothetical protein